MPVLILLVLAIISFLLAQHEQQRLAHAKAAVRPIEQDHLLQRMNDLLNARLGAEPTPAQPLSQVVPAVLACLRTADRYDVALGDIRLEQGGAVEGKDIEKLAKPLSGNLQLKRLRLQVTGQYRRYTGLLEYFDQLDTLPAAIDRIQIDRDQLAFRVDIYGT